MTSLFIDIGSPSTAVLSSLLGALARRGMYVDYMQPVVQPIASSCYEFGRDDGILFCRPTNCGVPINVLLGESREARDTWSGGEGHMPEVPPRTEELLRELRDGHVPMPQGELPIAGSSSASSQSIHPPRGSSSGENISAGSPGGAYSGTTRTSSSSEESPDDTIMARASTDIPF